MLTPPGNRTKGCRTEHAPFTLVELLVVMSLVVVLLVMLIGTARVVQRLAVETSCKSNLRTLSLALIAYRSENLVFPPGNLPEAVADYGMARSVFYCPKSNREYEPFYVPHQMKMYKHDYLIGCPYHGDRRINGYHNAAALTEKAADINWNGSRILPGDIVTGGNVKFEDGSVAQITAGTRAMIVASFWGIDGNLHSILRLNRDVNNGVVNLSVAKGSRFEVVTPAAITGAHGTQFMVKVLGTASGYQTQVDVSEGKVLVLGQTGKSVLLQPGTSATFDARPGEALIDFAN